MVRAEGENTIRVLFFGPLRERFGARVRRLQAPPHGLTLHQLKTRVTEGEADALAALAPPVRVAVDKILAAPDDLIRAGQEVAFLPVFSGG